MTLLHTCTPNTNIYIVTSTKMMQESVFCLVNVLCCVTYWNIYLYCIKSKEIHKSCACFQHANMTKESIWSGICMLKQAHDLCVSLLFVQCRHIPICKINREKGRDLTQSCDKNHYTHRAIQKATWQHQNATKNFDYTTIADRLRTVSWSNSSHPTGVVKPVYERSTFPLTATTV